MSAPSRPTSSRPARGPLPLTPKQRDAMRVLQEWIDERSVVPSFAEIGRELELASRSGVCRLLDQLEAKGWVRRPVYGAARCIEILARVPMPDFAALEDSHWRVEWLPEGIERRARTRPVAHEERGETVHA